MNRWVLVASLVAALSSGCASGADAKAAADKQAAGPKGRPNIVYIIADDLGYADIGVQGLSKDVKTPHIDSIAAAGVRFTNGYVSCPVCSPTRAGLMTGRYQQRFGHEFNPGPNAAETFGLPLDQVTLPQTLKSAGYVTGMVGKWHLGHKPEFLPTSRGFDEFYGFLGGAHAYGILGAGNNVMMRNDKPLTEAPEYLTDTFAKESVAFIDRHAKGDKPFFLYLPFNAIHTPMDTLPKYMERFPDVTDTKRRQMLAMLSAMDDAVGTVLAALDKQGVADNTLVIFHTDNGGPTRGNGSLNTPLRAFKSDVYEGGIRVPFMMKWKGHIPAGLVYDRPVIALDVFPTAVAAAGATPPKDVKLDGVNLLPHLDEASESSATPHAELFWRYGQQKWAIRQGNFKLVHNGPQASTELYDLSSDSGEQKDIAAQNPEVVKRLQAKFDEWNGELAQPKWQSSPRPGRQQREAGGGNAPRRARRAARQQQQG